MRAILLSASLLVFAQPLVAQQHDAHGHEHSSPHEEDSQSETASHDHTDHSSMDHSAMDHAQPDAGSEPPHEQMDHSAHKERFERAKTDAHTGMDHGGMEDMPIPQGPPPPEAFIGPTYAADAFVGEDVMAQSRARVAREVSGLPIFWFQGDRLEYRIREGDDGYLWDVQGYYGGDLDKFWFKSEGEGSFGEAIEDAEVQALYSRAIGPFFDLQAGVRQDLTGPTRTHAVVGVQGLAPYVFEVDAAAFLSTKGDLTARIEAEIDQRITNRLILQPRIEVELSAQDIPELGVGSGIDTFEAGLRLRYEFAREFAPYVGIDQEWKLGGSRDFALTDGEDPSVTSYVIGLRFWF